MVVPFLPLFLMQIGVEQHIATWSGAMADKYGRKPIIIRAGFVLFFVYTMTAFVTNPYELLALRIIQGLLSGYIPGAIALVATNTPEESIGYALSMISAASSTGTILGPLLGGLIAHFFNNRIAFASAGILVLLSTLLVIFWVREDNFVRTTQPSSMMATFKDAAANRPLLAALLLNLFTALSIMTIEPVITLYIAPLWGRLADKIGFPKVLLFGLIGGAVFPAINGLVVTDSTSIHGLFWITGIFLTAVFTVSFYHLQGKARRVG